MLLGSTLVWWYSNLLGTQCHTGTQPDTWRTMIYRIIPTFHRITNNTGTFLVYQYCPKICYLCSLGLAIVFQKLTIQECKNGLVLSSTRVPVSGTWSILFPKSWSVVKLLGRMMTQNCRHHFTSTQNTSLGRIQTKCFFFLFLSILKYSRYI